MAKKAKTDRQADIDSIRSSQSRSENRRGVAIVGVCVLVAVLIVGAAAFKPIKDWWDLRSYASESLSSIGAEASVCQDVTTETAEGSQDHVDVGTPMTYPDSPPAFGQHWNMWDSMERKVYTTSDRPELGELVHNLEHGFTILWYDETIADDSSKMDRHGRQALPRRPARRLHPLVRGWRRRDRPRQAGRCLAVLLRHQRLGTGDLHGGLPLHGLPGAQRGLTRCRPSPRCSPASCGATPVGRC